MSCQHSPSGSVTRASGGSVESLRNGDQRPDLIVTALARIPIWKDTHQHDGARDEQNSLGQSLHSGSAVGLVSVRPFAGLRFRDSFLKSHTNATLPHS